MLGEPENVTWALAQQRGRGIVESPIPIRRPIGTAPVDATEVVHDVAAAHDQHALAAERREAGAEVEVVLERLQGVDRQLHDGNVGVGEHVSKHRPGAKSEEHTSELQSLMRNSYAVFCLKKKT